MGILVLCVPGDFDLVELETALTEAISSGTQTAARIIEVIRREYAKQIGG